MSFYSGGTSSSGGGGGSRGTFYSGSAKKKRKPVNLDPRKQVSDKLKKILANPDVPLDQKKRAVKASENRDAPGALARVLFPFQSVQKNLISDPLDAILKGNPVQAARELVLSPADTAIDAVRVVGGLGSGATRSDIVEKTPSKVLTERGVLPKQKGAAGFLTNLGIDVLTDPFTLYSLGTSAIAKAAFQGGARVVGEKAAMNKRLLSFILDDADMVKTLTGAATQAKKVKGGLPDLKFDELDPLITPKGVDPTDVGDTYLHAPEPRSVFNEDLVIAERPHPERLAQGEGWQAPQVKVETPDFPVVTPEVLPSPNKPWTRSVKRRPTLDDAAREQALAERLGVPESRVRAPQGPVKQPKPPKPYPGAPATPDLGEMAPLTDDILQSKEIVQQQRKIDKLRTKLTKAQEHAARDAPNSFVQQKRVEKAQQTAEQIKAAEDELTGYIEASRRAAHSKANEAPISPQDEAWFKRLEENDARKTAHKAASAKYNAGVKRTAAGDEELARVQGLTAEIQASGDATRIARHKRTLATKKNAAKRSKATTAKHKAEMARLQDEIDMHQSMLDDTSPFSEEAVAARRTAREAPAPAAPAAAPYAPPEPLLPGELPRRPDLRKVPEELQGDVTEAWAVKRDRVIEEYRVAREAADEANKATRAAANEGNKAAKRAAHKAEREAKKLMEAKREQVMRLADRPVESSVFNDVVDATQETTGWGSGARRQAARAEELEENLAVGAELTGVPAEIGVAASGRSVPEKLKIAERVRELLDEAPVWARYSEDPESLIKFISDPANETDIARIIMDRIVYRAKLGPEELPRGVKELMTLGQPWGVSKDDWTKALNKARTEGYEVSPQGQGLHLPGHAGETVRFTPEELGLDAPSAKWLAAQATHKGEAVPAEVQAALDATQSSPFVDPNLVGEFGARGRLRVQLPWGETITRAQYKRMGKGLPYAHLDKVPGLTTTRKFRNANAALADVVESMFGTSNAKVMGAVQKALQSHVGAKVGERAAQLPGLGTKLRETATEIGQHLSTERVPSRAFARDVLAGRKGPEYAQDVATFGERAVRRAIAAQGQAARVPFRFMTNRAQIAMRKGLMEVESLVNEGKNLGFTEPEFKKMMTAYIESDGADAPTVEAIMSLTAAAGNPVDAGVASTFVDHFTAMREMLRVSGDTIASDLGGTLLDNYFPHMRTEQANVLVNKLYELGHDGAADELAEMAGGRMSGNPLKQRGLMGSVKDINAEATRSVDELAMADPNLRAHLDANPDWEYFSSDPYTMVSAHALAVSRLKQTNDMLKEASSVGRRMGLVGPGKPLGKFLDTVKVPSRVKVGTTELGTEAIMRENVPEDLVGQVKVIPEEVSGEVIRPAGDSLEMHLPRLFSSAVRQMVDVPTNDGAFVDFWKSANSLWKKWAIIGGGPLSIGYHARNTMSNMSNLFFDGVRDPKELMEGIKMRRAIENAVASALKQPLKDGETPIGAIERALSHSPHVDSDNLPMYRAALNEGLTGLENGLTQLRPSFRETAKGISATSLNKAFYDDPKFKRAIVDKVMDVAGDKGLDPEDLTRFTDEYAKYMRGELREFPEAPKLRQPTKGRERAGMATRMALSPLDMWLAPGGFIEDASRLTSFVHHAKAGMNLEDAALHAKGVMVDYDDLTPWEQTWMRERGLIPFYAWFRKESSLLLNWMMTQPGTFSKITKVQQQAWNNFQPDSDWIPGYYKDTGLPLPPAFLKLMEGVPLVGSSLNRENPFIDLNPIPPFALAEQMMLPEGESFGTGVLQTAGRNVNPAIGALLASISGKVPFSGAPLQENPVAAEFPFDTSGVRIPFTDIHAPNVVPGIVADILGGPFVQRNRQGEAYQTKKGQFYLEQMFPQLSKSRTLFPTDPSDKERRARRLASSLGYLGGFSPLPLGPQTEKSEGYRRLDQLQRIMDSLEAQGYDFTPERKKVKKAGQGWLARNGSG